jgi:hypothetical protein
METLKWIRMIGPFPLREKGRKRRKKSLALRERDLGSIRLS